MKTFKIPVEWQLFGEIEIEANNIEEALEIAKNNVEDYVLPEGNYVDGSFKINDDIHLAKIMNNIEE